jgi:hypothetical protein
MSGRVLMTGRLGLSLICLLTAFALGPSLAAAQRPTVEDLLARLDAYLLDYEERVSTLVAEERYEQWMTRRDGERLTGTGTRRTLLSDFLFVQLPGGHAWYGLRDPRLVDGKQVREHDGRLERLGVEMAAGSQTALQRADGIMRENAQHNIGPRRTINVPLQALALIHPRHHARFSFSLEGEDDLDGRAVSRIAFAEQVRPTIIRNDVDEDVFSRGTAWIDPATGAVVKTEFRLGGDSARNLFQTTVIVTYQLDAMLEMFVPAEMEEVYAYGQLVTHARARYTNFQQFRATARLVSPD